MNRKRGVRLLITGGLVLACGCMNLSNHSLFSKRKNKGVEIECPEVMGMPASSTYSPVMGLHGGGAYEIDPCLQGGHEGGMIIQGGNSGLGGEIEAGPFLDSMPHPGSMGMTLPGQQVPLPNTQGAPFVQQPGTNQPAPTLSPTPRLVPTPQSPNLQYQPKN